MTIAGTLAIGVTADMSKFESQVASGATAAGNAASRSVGNSFSRGIVANAGAIKAAGQKMSLGLTAPLALAGTVAVRTAADFESSMSQTAAALDKPMSSMGNLEELALKFGRSTVFSAGEVSSAMTELAKGGFSEAQIEAGALESTLNLAAAGGIELADSAGYITASMNAFGIEAKNSASIADALAGAADASAADVSDMAAALENVGATASLANQQLPDVTGTLAALAQNGTKGAEAGTTLRSALTSLIKPTAAAQAAMKQYGIDVYDANGEMRSLPAIAGQLERGFKGVSDEARNAALATIFGTYGIKAAKVLYTEGAEGIREYAAASRESGAAQKAAEARMGPTQRALEELSGAWETLMVQVGKDLAPVVSGIAGAMKSLTEWFSALPSQVRQAAVAFGVFAAAAGPILVAVGSIGGAIGKLRQFGDAASTACAAGGKAAGGCVGELGKSAGGIGRAASAMLRLGGAAVIVGGAWTAFQGGIDYLVKGWSQQFPQFTGAFQALGSTITRMVPGVGNLATSAQDLAKPLQQLDIPARTLDAIATFNSEVNSGVGFVDALGAAWDRWTRNDIGKAIGSGIGGSIQFDFRDQLRSQLAGVESDIKAKKFQLRATADPAVKEIRRAELAALRAARKTYRMRLQETGAKQVKKDVDALVKAAEKAARKTYRMSLKAENKDAKSKIKEAEREATRYKNQRATKRIDGNNSGLKKSVADSKRSLDSVKQKKKAEIDADGSKARSEAKNTKSYIDGLTPDRMPVDADTSAATSAAQSAASWIDSLTASIYVGVTGPGAGRAAGNQLFNSGDGASRAVVASGLAGRSGAVGAMAFGSRKKPKEELGIPTWDMDYHNVWAEFESGWARTADRTYADLVTQANRAAEDEEQAWARVADTRQRRWERQRLTAIRKASGKEASAERDVEAEKARLERKYADKNGDLTKEDRNRIKKELRDEKAVLKKKKQRRIKLENDYDRDSVIRNRDRQREERRRAREREDQALAVERAHEDEEEAARLAAEAAEKAAADKAEADEKAAEAARVRAEANDAVTESIVSQRDALRDSLAQSVQWTTNPASLIRNLNKTRGVYARFAQDLQTLQAHGLSQEAIAAMSRMDPREAGRLAARLVANPALVGQLNDAYAGVIAESTNIANRTTAAQFESVGAGMAAGILGGLQSGEAAVLAFIADLGEESLNAIKRTLGIASPSRAFEEVGESIGLGLAGGVASTESIVAGRVSRLVAIPGRVAPAAATVGGAGITQNIYPTPGMSETQIATASARELTWALGV